jgi:hypothetical protein
MEDVGSFMATWFILRPFGIFCGYLVYFPHFGMLHQEKSGNPASDMMRRGSVSHMTEESSYHMEPILRPLNLQLQRQLCSRRERFYSERKCCFFHNVYCW